MWNLLPFGSLTPLAPPSGRRIGSGSPPLIDGDARAPVNAEGGAERADSRRRRAGGQDDVRLRRARWADQSGAGALMPPVTVPRQPRGPHEPLDGDEDAPPSGRSRRRAPSPLPARAAARGDEAGSLDQHPREPALPS